MEEEQSSDPLIKPTHRSDAAIRCDSIGELFTGISIQLQLWSSQNSKARSATTCYEAADRK